MVVCQRKASKSYILVMLELKYEGFTNLVILSNVITDSEFGGKLVIKTERVWLRSVIATGKNPKQT